MKSDTNQTQINPYEAGKMKNPLPEHKCDRLELLRLFETALIHDVSVNTQEFGCNSFHVVVVAGSMAMSAHADRWTLPPHAFFHYCRAACTCVCVGADGFFLGGGRSYENLIRAAECRSPPPPASLLVFHNYHEILNVHTARSDSSHPEGERAPGCARPTTATNLHPHSSEPPPSLLLLQSFRVQLCPSCPGWPSDLWCSEKTEAISRAINRFFGNERWRFRNVTGVEARVMRDSLKVSKNNTKMQKSPRQPSYLHINKHLHAASRGERRSPALVLVADWIISFCFSSRIIIKLSVGFLF